MAEYVHDCLTAREALARNQTLRAHLEIDGGASAEDVRWTTVR